MFRNLNFKDIQLLGSKFNLMITKDDDFVFSEEAINKIVKPLFYAEAEKMGKREIPLFVHLSNTFVFLSLEEIQTQLDEITEEDGDDKDTATLNEFIMSTLLEYRFTKYKDKDIYSIELFGSNTPEELVRASLIILIGAIFLFKEKYIYILERENEIDLLTGLLYDFQAKKVSDTFNYKISSMPEIEEINFDKLLVIQDDINKERTKMVDKNINEYNIKIQKYLNQIQAYKKDIRQLEKERVNLLISGQEEKFKELTEFIRNNDKLKITSCDNGDMTVSVVGELNIWKDEYLESIQEVGYRNQFSNYLSSYMDEDIAKEIFKKIFETREVKLHISAIFNVDFSNFTIQAGEADVPIQVGAGVAIPNVHIHRYNCWSAANEAALNFMNAARYNEMLTQLIFATESLNLMDGTVMNGFGEQAKQLKCLEYNGKFYNAIELAKELKKGDDK